MTNRRKLGIAGAVVLVGVLALSTGGEPGDPVRVVIPSGATLSTVTDSLVAHDVIAFPTLFRSYARVRGAARDLKAGTYVMETGMSWREALGRVTRGEVATLSVTIPEGFRLAQMAERLAEITAESPDEVLAYLEDESLPERLGVPGPTLEGYLFPDTYRFAEGVPVTEVVRTMVDRYRDVWTDARRARLEEVGLTEREAATLASIVQAEARQRDEMPRIAGVYHNRLDRGWLLQADPTVLYALGGYRERLLFAAIDSVQDNPYNTYSQRGLPPGPIGSPGERAIDAALHPEGHDYMYFVAFPDGSHRFTRTLAEHNSARRDAVRAREEGRAGS